MQDWVDRTDSAMDYTVDSGEGAADRGEQPKVHRYTCGLLRRGAPQPTREPEYLLTSPAIKEEASDLSVVWP